MTERLSVDAMVGMDDTALIAYRALEAQVVKLEEANAREQRGMNDHPDIRKQLDEAVDLLEAAWQSMHDRHLNHTAHSLNNEVIRPLHSFIHHKRFELS